MSKKHKICGKCGRGYLGAGALSREDNKTEICPRCGTAEALMHAVESGAFKEDKKHSYVICQNDYPLATTKTTPDEVVKVVEELQRRCNENFVEGQLNRHVYIHYYEVPTIKDLEDIDKKFRWEKGSGVIRYK